MSPAISSGVRPWLDLIDTLRSQGVQQVRDRLKSPSWGTRGPSCAMFIRRSVVAIDVKSCVLYPCCGVQNGVQQRTWNPHHASALLGREPVAITSLRG